MGLRVQGKFILLLCFTFTAYAGQRFEIRVPDARETRKVTIYGDSIASGFNRECVTCGVAGGPFGTRFSLHLANSERVNVQGWNDSHAGHVIEKIYEEIVKNERELSMADYVLVDGGGNNFLRHRGPALCDNRVLQQELETIDREFLKIALFLRRTVPSRARVYFMMMYYPLIDQYRDVPCPGMNRSAHANFFPFMIESNYIIARRAQEFGFKAVDSFADLNCSDIDRNTNGLRDDFECRLQDHESLSDYRHRILTLEASGTVLDPLRKQGSDGRVLRLFQKDKIHPNPDGHERLGRVFSSAGL